ncbi:MAG: hypothetical protein HZB38_12640 [Planctomycetes bacterium]|nr:hypothetical protein [Planctomycetota bacterium]
MFNALLVLHVLMTSPDAQLRCSRDTRNEIQTGVVSLHRFFATDAFRSEYEGTAYFSPTQYRLDVHETAAFPSVLSPSGEIVDPSRMVFDGNVVFERILDVNGFAFSARALRDTRIPIFNARMLGIPRHPGDELTIQVDYMNQEHRIEKSTWNSDGTVCIRLAPRTPPDVGTARLDLTIDPDKGWSVVSFAHYVISKGKTRYIVRGTSRIEQFGKYWFPSWCRTEQYRGSQTDWSDETLDWTEEFFVSGAEFNVDLSPDTFTLDGIGAYDGDDIISYVSGVSDQRHQSIRPRPPCPHMGKAKDGTKSAGDTVPLRSLGTTGENRP